MSTDQNIGPVALTLPDLADPGYRGESEPLTTEMHFNYTGWLRAQKIVPATILKVGANDLVIVNAAGTRRRCNPSDASPAKVHLGQVGLSSPHRQLNLCDRQSCHIECVELSGVSDRR
jgi:hypothetical protein